LAGNDRYAHSRLAFFLFFIGVFNSFTNFGHHTYHLPQSHLIKWISCIASLCEAVIVVKLLLDIVKNTREKASDLPAVHFLLKAGTLWSFLTVGSAVIISVPPINTLIHGTHFVMSHAMGSMIGIDSVVLWATLALGLGALAANSGRLRTWAATVFANQLEANQQVRTPVDLVVWPENVVNPVPEPTSGWRHEGRLYADDAAEALTAEATRLDAVLVPGWFHRDADDPTANLNYQTAIEPDGTVVDRYDKVRTVPFGEYVPLRSLVERLAPDMLPARDLRPGTGPAVLDTSVGRLGVAISWEVFFEHRTRDAVRNGGEVILNPTNGASYWLTQVQTQQVAASRLRALETGRWVLQVAPTGFSAVIDPLGRVLQQTGVGEQAVLHHRVERRQGLTWASRMGTWPMAVLSLLATAGAWTASRRRT
jgi:predicted amidohydrolase